MLLPIVFLLAKKGFNGYYLLKKTMSKKKLKINSQNLLPIIKKWLYSSEDIFLRELVSNSCDALRKLSLINKTVNEDDLRITVSIDKEKNTISISDNGIGMTKEEVEKYISQIAFSSAQELRINTKRVNLTKVPSSVTLALDFILHLSQRIPLRLKHNHMTQNKNPHIGHAMVQRVTPIKRTS